MAKPKIKYDLRNYVNTLRSRMFKKLLPMHYAMINDRSHIIDKDYNNLHYEEKKITFNKII